MLFILQNPWRRGRVARRWDNRAWELALWRSQTGKRLREYIPEGVEARVINANPVAAGEIGTVRLPDVKYVLRKVEEYKPGLVVLLGKVAADGLWPLLIAVPVLRFAHPCWRLLSKRQTAEYRGAIERELAGAEA